MNRDVKREILDECQTEEELHLIIYWFLRDGLLKNAREIVQPVLELSNQGYIVITISYDPYFYPGIKKEWQRISKLTEEDLLKYIDTNEKHGFKEWPEPYEYHIITSEAGDKLLQGAGGANG